MKTIPLALLPALALLGACAETSAPVITSQGSTDGQYAKPGATVEFAHVVKSDGATAATVTLDVREAMDEGVLRVDVRGTDALFVTTRGASYDMARGDTHTLEFRASSDVEGLHYVAVTATTPDGMGRAYAVPVQLGTGGVVGKADAGAVVARPDGTAVRVMDATETIDGEIVQAPGFADTADRPE